MSTGGSTADGTGEFRFFSTPSARVFEMLNSSFGDQVISSSLNYEQQLDNGVDQYSVMTSKDAEGNIYAAIVNLNLEGGNKMNIRIDGQDLTGRIMEVQSLSGDSFYAENTLDQPDNVKIDRSEATISGADAAVTLAPHSFTIVKIHAAQDEGGSGTEDPDPENPGGEDPDVEDPGTEKPGGEDPDAEDPGTGDPAGSGKPAGTEGSQNTGVSADAGKDTDVPATGEGRSLAMFAVLCILAGTGTVYLGYRRVKNG